MNENQKQLYLYIKNQGATDLSIDDFYASYGNNPEKAKDVFDFVNGKEMTDLNESDFFNAYFSDVKKKDSSKSNGEMEVTESITEQVQEGNGSSDSSSDEEDIMLVGETIDPPKKQEQPPQKTSRFDPMSVEPITAPETEQQFEAPTIPEEQFENIDYVKKVKEKDQSLIDNNIYENKDQIRDMRYEMASGFLGESDKREYELLQKIKKVDEKIEIYKDPEQNKWLQNSEKALSDAIKEKEGYEQSLTKIKEQYLNESQEAIKKARFELSKDPENKQLKENLLKLQTKYKSFFKPIEVAKAIYVSTPEMQKQEGETPYEKFLNYYDAAVLEYDEARDAMGGSDFVLSTIPLIDDISGASPVIRRYVRAYKKLETLTPIALLNRKALKEDNFFSQFGKNVLSTLSDASLYTTEQEESSIIFDVLQKADVGKNVSEENIKALESSFDMTTGEKAGSMLGATIAMMPAFMAGGGAVRGLKNITKLGRAFDKLKDTNRFSKFLLGAVEQGVSYEAAQFFGDESIKDEASFLSGALGETFSKGLSAVGKRNVYMQIMLKAFGNNASKASKFLAIAAQRTGTGLGEMAEEYGNELGNIINESDGDLKKVKDLWVERFGKLDQNLEFGLSTFGMGVLFGSATKAGQQFADTYKDWLSGQTDDVKAKFGEIEKEVNQDAQKIVNEVKEEVTEEAAPEVEVKEAASEVETAPTMEDVITEEVEANPRKNKAPVYKKGGKKLLFTGSPRKFTTFDKSKVGSNADGGSPQGIFFSNDPEVAGFYANEVNGDGMGQLLNMVGLGKFKGIEPTIYSAVLNTENVKEVEFDGQTSSTTMDKNAIIKKAFEEGFDAVVLKNIKDGPSVPQDVTVVKDIKFVSQFEATQDGRGRKIRRSLRNTVETAPEVEATEEAAPEAKVELEQAKTPGEQITTTEEQTLFKGMQPKIKDGKPFSAHKIEKGEFAAADKKLASDYKGDKPLKKFTVPPGTTIDVVKVEDTNQPLSEVKKQEEKLIDDSDAQVVKLITRDARGTVEEQYIIKDDAILETSEDVDEEVASEVDELDQFIEEQAESLEKELKKENPNFQLSQDESSEVRKEKLKEEALERFSEQDKDTNTEKAYEIEDTPLDPVPVNVTENKKLSDKVKKFKLKDIIGKKLNLLMADKLKVELKDPSKPYNEETNPYVKMGGMFFPLMEKMFGKVAWASIDRAAALKIVQGAMEGDASAVYNMGDSGVDSNIAMAIELDKKIPDSKKKEIFKAIRNRVLSSSNKKVKKAHKYFKDAKTLMDAFESMSNDTNNKTKLSVDERAAVMRHILPNSLGAQTKIELFKKLDSLGISLDTLRDGIGEQAAKDLPIGAISMILEVTNSDGVKVSDLKKDLDQKLKNGDIDQKQYDIEYNNIKESAIMDQDSQTKEGIPTHNNYPVYIRGKALGMMEETSSIKDLISKYVLDIAEKITGVRKIKSGKVLKDATKAEQVIFDKIKKAKNASIGGLKKIAQDILDNDIKKLKKGEVRKNSRKLLRDILASNNLAKSTIILSEFEKPFAKMVDSTYSQSIGAMLKSAAQTSTTSYKIKQPVISNYKQFVNQLMKAFPGVEVMEDQKSFDKLIDSIYTKKLSTKSQKIYGAVYNGKLYINPAFKNFNTPIHEFGHIWINTVKTLKPELYNKGLDLVQGTEYETSVRNNSDYKRVVDQMRKDGATEEQVNEYILEEALAIAIGDKGESFVKASVSRDFSNWLKDLYKNIKKMMGISKYTSEQLENITLDEFVQAVSVDLLSGEKLFDAQVKGFSDALQLMTAPNGDSMYDIIQYGRSKGYPDKAIRKVLIDRKFKAKDVDVALEINLDIFTKVPVEFQRVADGAKSAVELFEGVKKQLDKFIKENKKASITKIREQGIKILKSNPIFKEQNEQVKMELIDGFNRSILLDKGNVTFEKKMNNLRKSIKDRIKGSNDLAKVHEAMKRMVLSNLVDLQFSKYKKSDLNKIIKTISALRIENIKINSEKILEIIEKQRAAEKQGAIKAIRKLISDSSARKSKLDKGFKSFFKEAKDILKTLTSGNEIKIEALEQVINNPQNQSLNDKISDKKSRGEKLTQKEIEMYNTFLAYDMFKNINNMTLEEVKKLYNSLKGNKKEGIEILKEIKAIESKKRLAEAEEATDQIKQTNPELFDENGNLLDSNQIKAKRKEIYEKFKKLKIPEAISDFVKLFKYGTYNYIIRSLKNDLIYSLETLTNIADRTTKGLNLFRKKIYDRVNVMNTNRLAGLQAMEKKLNSIVENIGAEYKSKTGVTLKGYKAIQVIAQRKRSMKIDGIVSSSGGKSIGRFGVNDLMTIYAYWKNKDVKKKLIDQGFTQDKIDAIEKHLGKELTAFTDAIVDFLSNEYYDGINEVYSEVNYNNLGAIENYFPLTTLSTEKDSKKYSKLTGDGNFSEAFNTETAPYWKARTDKETDVDLTDMDFFTKLDRYINTMEEYKAYAKGAKELQSFFEIPAVKTLLENLFIDNAIRGFVLKQLAPNSLGVDAYKGFAPFRALLSNITRVALGFKAIQIAKQAISFVQAFPKYDYFGKNYKGKVPSVIRRRIDMMMFLIDAARMYASLSKDLIGKDGVIAEAIEASPDFKDRWTKALKGDVYSLESGTGVRVRGGRRKFSRADRGAAKLSAIQGSPTTIGDVLGVLGYMVNYKRNIANGMNKSDALRELNDYNSTQQPRRESDRIKLQGSTNPLVRTFLMFGSAIFAQQNKIAQSTRNVTRSIFSGKIPRTEDVRSFVINGFLVNILFEMMANIAKLIDGDDEDIEDLMNSVKESLLLVKQAYALPFIGSALEQADAGGRAIAKLDFKFYEKSKHRSQDVVNPFAVMYRRALKNADTDRGILYNSAKPLTEALVGFNSDPFIGAYNYYRADDLDFMEQEEEMLRAMGITPSYQPKRLRQDVRDKKYSKEVKEIDAQQEEFYETEGDVRGVRRGKEGREGVKREGSKTREKRR